MKRRTYIAAINILATALLTTRLWASTIRNFKVSQHLDDASLAPPPWSSCTTSADCAFNGECVKTRRDNEQDPEATGQCRCFPGWIGPTCEVLDTLPSLGGLRLPNHTSSWGGSVAYDAVSNRYHMFASEIVNGCGLYDWTTNSRVIRATSASPYGSYMKEQVIVPVFAHDANVIRAPTGEWVLFVTARKGVVPKDCRQANRFETSTLPTSIGITEKEETPPKDTYMLWADQPQGPWSSPVMVLNSTEYNSDFWNKTNRTAKCDSNLNGIILNDNSLVGLWRKCETPELLTIPHLLTATDWKNASTYVPHYQQQLFPLAGSGAEDPSNVWATKTTDMKPHQIALHVLFHDEQATRCMLGACGGTGRHAVALWDTSQHNSSLATGAWRYSTWNAYDRNVAFGDGKVLRSDTRARPHVILDPSTQQPMALSTGVKETSLSGYSWTVVTPLRTT